MIVFSCMIWHAIYLVLYEQNAQLAERCDRLAMLTFALVVFLVHVFQTVWFFVAFRKRLDLEKLDKEAAINNLKYRMNMNANNIVTKTKNTSVTKKNMNSKQTV